jgi:hypothetical protein
MMTEQGLKVFEAIEEYLQIPKGTVSNDEMRNLTKQTFGEVLRATLAIARRHRGDEPETMP